MPRGHAYTLKPGHPSPGSPNLLRPPIALQVGAGILTRFPSATTLVLTLGADSPCADERGAGNLGLSATELFTLFIATHVSIRTSDTSSSPLEPPSPAYGTLSYHRAPDSNFLPRNRAASPIDSISEGRFGLGRAYGLLTQVSLVQLSTSTSGLNQTRNPRFRYLA